MSWILRCQVKTKFYIFKGFFIYEVNKNNFFQLPGDFTNSNAQHI